MSRNINEVVVKDLLEKFEIKIRDNGKSIVTCNSECTLKNFIHKVHGDKRPDNFVYQTIFGCLEHISNSKNYGVINIDIMLEALPADNDLDDLIDWSIRQSRSDYVDEVLSESKIKTYLVLLRAAQAKEIKKICIQTLDYLVETSD